jgi:hypothetical protein
MDRLPSRPPFSPRALTARAGALCLAFAFSSTVVGGTADAADVPIPVHFSAGSSSADVAGTVPEHGAVTYSLVAEAGQTMALELQMTGSTSPMQVGVPGGVFAINVGRLGSDQRWTGTILKAGPVDIVIRGVSPVPNDPDPTHSSDYSLHVSILGHASARVDRIRQVDFANATVSLAPGSANQLKNGKLAPPYRDKYLHIYAKAPVFGTIDGYAGELAAVFLESDDSGTGQFDVVDLFALVDGRPALVAIFSGGDRAEGGLEKAWIEGGRLVVDIDGSPPGGPACCPTFTDTVRYRFADGKLVRDGRPSRRPYHSP